MAHALFSASSTLLSFEFFWLEFGFEVEFGLQFGVWFGRQFEFVVEF